LSSIIEGLDAYSEKPNATIQVNLQIEYLKTSAFKIMLDAFKILKRIRNNGNT
jgi:hypothetical protein